jgi:DNA-binding transcriptional LysR family regulator
MFDWNDLRHFLAFARQGSTVAAAKALGVNQSTVHRRLVELERRLGSRLIERHIGGYRLTELGEELQPYAERVEAAVAALERRLASCDQDLTGTIRVTCPASVADRLARTHLLDVFHARHPSLQVELVMSDRFLDLSKGEADIAIRAGESRDGSLVGRKIAEGRWGIYASRSYVERHGRPERLEDIDHHFVVAPDGAIAPHATIAARSDNWPGFVLAVKSGSGLVARFKQIERI